MRLAQREAIADEPDPARRIEQGIRAIAATGCPSTGTCSP